MKRLPLQVLAITLTRVVLNTLVRMVYPFLAVFGRGLGVDLATLSLALTARSAAGAFGPFLASAADSRGRRFGMLAGMLMFSLSTLLVVLRPSFLTFVLAIILGLLGKYVYDASMQAYLGDQVPYRRRGLVLGVTEFGWSLAFIVGVPLVGLAIARWGWVAPFPLLSALGLLGLVVLSWLLPRDARPPLDRPGLWRNFRAVFTHPPALAGLLLGLLISLANEMVNLVFGVWMEASFGLKIAALGAASAVIGLSELGGEGLVTLLTDRLGKERSVAAGVILNCLAALALPYLGRSFAMGLVGLFFFYITFEFAIVSAIPLMSEVLPPARATLMSVNQASNSTGRALGALLAVPVYASGILASGLATVGFNLAALAALAWMVRVNHKGMDHEQQTSRP